MIKRNLPLPLVLLVLTTCTENLTDNTAPNPQSVAVLTQHNDNTRSRWNDNETALTTSNVNVQQFGAVFTLPVDDQVYAQPLVLGHVSVGGGTHNVVYIATVNNTLYAYDGDDGTLYWQRGVTAPGMRPPRNTDMTGACGGTYTNFSGNIGIVGTPVIDSARGTMYFVARSATGSTFVQYLHAVNIVDGNEIAGSPTKITATYSGNGDGSVNGVIAFDAQRQNQRQGLTLLNGLVYVTFSSHCDWGPYHGWILGYDAATLHQQVVYNATPNGYAGGMWESGTGMAADAEGNLYVVTGNGTVGDAADPTSPTNRAESAPKLTPAGATQPVGGSRRFRRGSSGASGQRDPPPLRCPAPPTGCPAPHRPCRVPFPTCLRRIRWAWHCRPPVAATSRRRIPVSSRDTAPNRSGMKTSRTRAR